MLVLFRVASWPPFVPTCAFATEPIRTSSEEINMKNKNKNGVKKDNDTATKPSHDVNSSVIPLNQDATNMEINTEEAKPEDEKPAEDFDLVQKRRRGEKRTTCGRQTRSRIESIGSMKGTGHPLASPLHPRQYTENEARC